MSERYLTKEDIVEINKIIREINYEKEKLKIGLTRVLDEYKCVGLILLLFRKFYGDKINEGIYAAILSDFDIRRDLIDIFFKYSELLLSLDMSGNSIQIDYGKKGSFNNKNFLQIEDLSYSIHLVNRNMVFRFWDNELEIIYKSELGEHCREILLFDEDGLVSERKIEKVINPIKINNILGYGCRSVVTIKRSDIYPCYVTVLDEIKITSNMRVDRKCAGYIHPLFLFDLKSVCNLDEEFSIDVINSESCFREKGIIDKFFPSIKRAFIDRLNRSKNNGFSRKR